MKKMPAWKHPFGVPNQKHSQGMMANYRTAGLADMALAIEAGRPHRCSMELALHAVDVMTAILKVRRDRQVRRHADELRAAGGTGTEGGKGAAGEVIFSSTRRG